MVFCFMWHPSPWGNGSPILRSEAAKDQAEEGGLDCKLQRVGHPNGVVGVELEVVNERCGAVDCVPLVVDGEGEGEGLTGGDGP